MGLHRDTGPVPDQHPADPDAPGSAAAGAAVTAGRTPAAGPDPTAAPTVTERALESRRPWEAWHPSGRGILGAVVTGIIAYVAAWLMAFLVLVLTLSSLARSGTGEPGGLQEGLTEAVQAGPDPDPSTALAAILVLPTQLVGMAFLGPLDVQVGFEMFGLGLALAGTLAWVPLAVTATAFLVAAGSSYLARRRRPLEPRRSTVLATCSGVTVAVLAWVATAATAVDL